MKRYFTYLLTALPLLLLLAGCKKVAFDETPQGEALGSFVLQAPMNNIALNLNAATPNSPVVIEWSAAPKGVNTSPKYKWVAAQSTGSISQPIIEIPSDNGGLDTRLTLTQKQIDDALAAKGIAANTVANLIWTVVADNGTTKVQANQVYNISIRRFGDGAAPFMLYGPLSSSSNAEINPSSTTDYFDFKWQPSKPANAAATVSYRINFYDESSTAVTPLFSIASANNGYDTTLRVSWKQISDSLTARGLTDPGQAAKLRWNVTATSGNFSQTSDFSNQLSIVRLVRMYLVGSINGWNINTPFELIADKLPSRNGKVFYTYIKLNADDEFLFVKTPGDWGSKYGNTGSSGAGFNTQIGSGDNFKVPAAGIYRLTIDLGANKAYVQEKQVGIVGEMQGWNPGAPIYGSYLGRDKFMIIADAAPGQKFKLHDGPVWDNGSPEKARWWGKGAQDGVLDYDGNGAELSNSTSGNRFRVIWDGTNTQSVRYSVNSAAEMRVVGDGIQGVNAWDPGASPQMTYKGNGIWEATLTLVGDKQIKFLAGNAWGAFDYEDAGSGATTVGTARGIKGDGSDNFKTPAATGTYTITLNEYTGTVTFNY